MAEITYTRQGDYNLPNLLPPQEEPVPHGKYALFRRRFLDVYKRQPQGDGSLAGAVYGLYKGDTLIDSCTTDENGQFTTGYYVCDSDWTIREISPSEGYLLDSTIHEVGAEPELYEIELNDTCLLYTSRCV